MNITVMQSTGDLFAKHQMNSRMLVAASVSKQY